MHLQGHDAPRSGCSPVQYCLPPHAPCMIALPPHVHAWLPPYAPGLQPYVPRCATAAMAWLSSSFCAPSGGWWGSAWAVASGRRTARWRRSVARAWARSAVRRRKTSCSATPPRGRTARRPRPRGAAAWTAALVVAAAASVPSASPQRRHGRRSAAAAASPGQPAHCSAALREAGQAAPFPPPPPPPPQQQLSPQPRRPPLPASLLTWRSHRRLIRGTPPPSPRPSHYGPRRPPSRSAPPPCRRSAPCACAAGCAPRHAASPTAASPAAPPLPPPPTAPARPSPRRGPALPRRATPPRRPPPRPSAPQVPLRGCGVEILPPRAAAVAHSGSAWGGCRPARRPRVLTTSAWCTGLRRRAAPHASEAPCYANARARLGAASRRTYPSPPPRRRKPLRPLGRRPAHTVPLTLSAHPDPSLPPYAAVVSRSSSPIAPPAAPPAAPSPTRSASAGYLRRSAPSNPSRQSSGEHR